jgi:glycosyltransferase involved in cell wall biosynthesis
MSKLKVLYVAHNHPSVRPGGAEEHALEVHRAMRNVDGMESVLLAKGGPPVGAIGSLHLGTYISPVGATADEYFLYTDGYDFDYINLTITDKDFYTKHFREFLRAIAPDVVHFQHTHFLGYDLIREVHNTIPNAPIIYTLHEYLPICARDGQMIRVGTNELCDGATPRKCHGCFPNVSAQNFFLRKRLIQSQLALVDVFLAPSRFLMQRYIEWGIPEEKIRFEDYGREPGSPLPDEPRASRNRLGFFGQFSGYKGVDVLMQAMRLIGNDVGSAGTPAADSRGARPNLVLHGANLDLQDGQFQNLFGRLLEETRDNVTLLGRYDRKQLPALMAGVDWVIVPSIWWENSPLVIQEAFMYQRPVICSDIGGMAEKVTDGVNGLHFKVGDPVSLARVIERAVASPTLWDELRRGIPPVYTLDAQVLKLKRIYESLVADRRVNRRDRVSAN